MISKKSRMLTVKQMCSVCNRDGKDFYFRCSTPECQLLCFRWWWSSLAGQGSAGFYWRLRGLILGSHCSWSVPTLLSQPALFNTSRAGNSSYVLLPIAGGLTQHSRKVGRNRISWKGQEMGYFQKSIENLLKGGIDPAPGFEIVQSRVWSWETKVMEDFVHSVFV